MIALAYLNNEEYKARRYLAQCGMEMFWRYLMMLSHGFIFYDNKQIHTKSIKPGQISGMYDEIHTMSDNIF